MTLYLGLAFKIFGRERLEKTGRGREKREEEEEKEEEERGKAGGWGGEKK